ncbi:hypothetical protein G8C92_13050 [Paenibacillus donghaensis]|uniref:CD3324 family protein n=1 Tax=Paenibacillus donghaensis TaxID=414771 RepID=UPI0018843F57|nr:CD3324 family protein [Paenibacillus donghaensis]MBE9914964.1 hypothetical protein [Paenibacillus donghaensis]
MKYINADEIFPSELLEEIQKYVHGKTIYIPKAKGSRKKWGEKNGNRALLQQRNDQIREQYAEGASIGELAARFYLSYESIRKIIYSK